MDKIIENLMNEAMLREQIVESFQIYGGFDKKMALELIKNYQNLAVSTELEVEIPEDDACLEMMPEGKIMQILLNQSNCIMMEIYNKTK